MTIGGANISYLIATIHSHHLLSKRILVAVRVLRAALSPVRTATPMLHFARLAFHGNFAMRLLLLNMLATKFRSTLNGGGVLVPYGHPCLLRGEHLQLLVVVRPWTSFSRVIFCSVYLHHYHYGLARKTNSTGVSM